MKKEKNVRKNKNLIIFWIYCNLFFVYIKIIGCIYDKFYSKVSEK